MLCSGQDFLGAGLRRICYFHVRKSITRSINVDVIVMLFFVSESLMLAFNTVVRKPFARWSFLLIGIG